MERRHVSVSGVVQGVGFRPFVYRLAHDLNVAGWVANSPQGAIIEIEAPPLRLDTFITRLQDELPRHAAIQHLDCHDVSPLGESTFEIRQSSHEGAKSALILPDLATCPDCLREIHDPADRHYHYPFTNCTHCGPRFSIIHALPYDRANTTMSGFTMCARCRAEYEDPLNRRFHAQPTACPHCGPQVRLSGRSGKTLSIRWEALLEAAAAIRQGQIIALKGLGGYQLLADARNPEAIRLLRQRKGRYEKPFALMFPTPTQIASACTVNDAEWGLLESAAAPIVLLPYQDGAEIAPQVAPDNPYLGVMLPYTPLHHLLLEELGFPIVVTSGNVSDEPIVIDDNEALAKLSAIADLFLTHNRPIARPLDDSVAFVFEHEPVLLRRARGYVPTPIHINAVVDDIIAVGAQQKNTVAVAHDDNIFLSQHLGDVENLAANENFKRTLVDFQTLYELRPSTIACDLHPDYASTHYAEESGLKIVKVQHHYAHVLSCMAERQLDAPVLGVAWDGTGYGSDGTIWGGEFLQITEQGFTRAASLCPFRLPGGDLAAREPRRSALGLLYALYGENLPCDRLDFTEPELRLLLRALKQGINAPLTSSVGRLFDAVAALVGLRQRCSFEGQAAMALEYAQRRVKTDEWYPFEITSVTGDDRSCRRMIEWKPMIAALLDEHDPAVTSAKFHNTLAAIIVAVAEQVGEPVVALSGGCFQNRTLLDRAIKQLRRAGFRPYWQQQIPSNDGGIALGQIMAATRGMSDVSGSSGQSDQH